MCLQFALDQGCPCNIDACALAAVGERGNIDCLRLLLDRFPLGKAAPVPAAQQRAVCAAAAAEGRVACLQLLHARGWEWDATACASAALGGFTCCLDYLLTQQCPCDETAAEHAAMAGTMACLVLVGERGAPLSIAAAEAAARNGNVDCLQYLLFRMSEEMRRTCSAPCALAAAEGGSVECLGLLLKAQQEDKGSSSNNAKEWNWAVMERRANPHSSAKAWIATVRAAHAAASMTVVA